LVWHRHTGDKSINGCYLPKCAACGSRPNRSQAINRFIAYTDAPLEAMIDTLFELLPESKRRENEASNRKLLVFSDGRQDAAFFASDFQRNHTETMYRQMVWQAFDRAKNANEMASVKQLISTLVELFLQVPIPHPDRNSSDHHRSYCSTDSMNRLDNEMDCRELAEKRAKELVLREFAIPYARRSSLEAYALLACHIQLKSDVEIVQWTAQEFEISLAEAHLLLLGLTDIIRRSGIVSVQGASAYFPETGGAASRPAILNARGRSKQVVFLEKTEEDKKRYEASPAFLRREGPNVMNRWNRLGWYFWQMFHSINPSRESLVGLFQQLLDSKLLVNQTTTKGFQLNWELLSITQTEADWYQCDRCQQVVHIPGLSQLENPKLNLHACRAYRCTGKLHLHTAEKIQMQAQTHYQQYLIKERQPLPLRSEEHTAQLGTEELAQRENNFRQGNINLLSCSTTLEMGVDIGELQAVVLRNFPPHVSNYQQRAGRAGRRTDGVALTLMYGQRRPHDRFYFEQPERLIAGTNQIPRLDPSNGQIQERHIRAELISAFLATQNLGAEKVRISEFFGLNHDHPVHIDAPEPSSMIARLESWLHSDHARELTTEWIKRLANDISPKNLVMTFLEGLQHFKNDQLNDWNELVDLLTPLLDEIISLGSNQKERRPLEGRRDNFEAELRKVASRQLHDQLVQASILPIYGFPIDVVRLLTGKSNEFRASKGRHRLERDRRLALSEYAPGQDIVVDDRVYHSVGVMHPENLEQKYYWECKFCNHFLDSYADGSQTIEECPICRQRPETKHQKVYAYRVPKAFTTDWTKDPEVTPYLKPLRQPTSQVFLANLGNPSESWTDPNQIYSLTSSRSGQFFLANRGGFVKGYHAFHICQRCGRDLTELVQQQVSTSKSKRSRSQPQNTESSLAHKHPLRGTDCQGGYDLLHLGHEFKSDLLKIEFCNSPQRPPALFGEVAHYQGDRTVESIAADPQTNANSGRSFWHSLTYALLAAAAEVLDIRREELDGLFRPVDNGQAEIIIYDNVPGGAGYSRRIAEGFAGVLQKAYELTSTCSCQASCYDCLRTYSNQIFHVDLDRHLVSEFLQPIVETIRPDETLIAFGRGSHRISVGAIADELPLLFRTAQTAMLYLPQLQDDFKLNHNAPIPWIALLTDAINSIRNSGIPLQLIVHQIPAPDSDVHRFLRKRLAQWIDEQVLVLYQSVIDILPTLTVSTYQNAQTALGLHLKNSSYEWMQTRQSEGVKEVQKRLDYMKERLILASDLEDPDTTLITPTPGPEWDNLTLEELQRKLGLTTCLSGSQITKLTYHDRYFYESGAKLFAALIHSENITPASQILVETQENPRDKDPAPERQRQLEVALKPLSSGGAKLTVTVHGAWSHRIEHKRILKIWRADGDYYQVIFDKGIDFLQKRDQAYYVKEATYVVINRTAGLHHEL
jgi:Domain of unknown function (DUF1998)/Helicase conserved C-terminal domain